MGEGESVLDALYDDEDFEGAGDVEMLDVEEGELVETTSGNHLGESSGGDGGGVEDGGVSESQNNQSKNNKRRKKKKNKRKRGGGGGGGGAASNVTDINRFVLDTCRRLKERKSYMVYTAVGCLGVSALSELLKEVDAILSCGGQMTADGKRFRNGGGILWNIMKTREPTAYKEIMKKSKEFEKQFKQQNVKQVSQAKKETSPVKPGPDPLEETPANVPDGVQSMPPHCSKESFNEVQRKSVHGRIRMPVSYDDLVGDNPKGDSL